MILWTCIVLPILVLCVRVYQKLSHGICRSSAHMVGKVVIVTGGNSGIGLETAKDLACRGARIILACRSMKRAAKAKEEIVKFSGNEDVHCKQLDLAHLSSVREFCTHILNTEKRLDVLINNAGAGKIGNYKTEDGIHIGMQVNYFGPFLLTCLLLPLLKSSTPSRIVNVSSKMHILGDGDLKRINKDKYWSDYLMYANSKMYLNLMTLELSRRLKGTGVTVNSLHPGLAATNIFRNIPSIMRILVEQCVQLMFQNSWEASQTSIYLAVAPEVKSISGRYFSDCRETKPSKICQDAEIARRLWTETEKLVKFELPAQSLMIHDKDCKKRT